MGEIWLNLSSMKAYEKSLFNSVCGQEGRPGSAGIGPLSPRASCRDAPL